MTDEKLSVLEEWRELHDKMERKFRTPKIINCGVSLDPDACEALADVLGASRSIVDSLTKSAADQARQAYLDKQISYLRGLLSGLVVGIVGWWVF